MSLDLWMLNLLRYLAQSTAVVACSGLLVWALRIRAPKARLTVWHAMLVICLCLPFVQPLRTPTPDFEQRASDVVAITTSYAIAESSGFPLSPAQAIAIVLLGGCALRWTWLAAGFARLRSRRRHSRRMDAADEPFASLEVRLGVAAAYHTDARVKAPVTYGIRRPVVLLPASFFDLRPESQRAVVCHELLHVKRGDWLFTMLEEIVRGLLWFHPAVWWLLSRIQLTREQAVDEAVVQVTRDQDRYLGALLEIAAVRMEPDLAPAPLFLRKHHLTKRIAFLIQGGCMTKRHLYVSMISVFALLPLAAGLAIYTWPLHAGQAARSDAPGVEVGTPPFPVLHRTGVEYPAAALKAGISGDVVVDLRLDGRGDVIDAAVVSGPAALRAAVLKSVLDWHFDVGASQPEHFEIGVRFTAPAQPEVAPAQKEALERGSGTANTPKLTVKSVNLQELPGALAERVRPAVTIQPGDTLTADELKAALAPVREVDSHLAVSLRSRADKRDDVDVYLTLRDPKASTSPAVAAGPGRIRLGGNAAAMKLTRKVTPVYPAEAKAGGIQGRVRFTAVIAKDGNIKQLDLMDGDPVLAQAAQDAVRQWQYEPTLLNGNPVEVITQIDVNFTLAK